MNLELIVFVLIALMAMSTVGLVVSLFQGKRGEQAGFVWTIILMICGWVFYNL
jgi:hypothetical protein